MRPLSEALNVLVATAQDVINKPQMMPARLPESFAALAAEIRKADGQPAENVRCTRAAVMMISAIEGFYESRDSTRLENPWLMLAGSLLPLLRVDAWVALTNEKQARGHG